MAAPTLDVFLNGVLAGALPRKANGNLQFRFLERVVEAALVLASEPEFAGPIAERIADGIGERARRFA